MRKKLIALLMVVCAMGMMTACDLFSEISESSSDTQESQEISSEVSSEEESSDYESSSSDSESDESSSESASDEDSSEEVPDNAVSSLTGGGDFNAGNNYN